MTHCIIYSPRALRQLQTIFDWIAGEGAPENALRYVTEIYNYCDNLASFPMRGRVRNDLAPGLRTIGFRRRVIIAFLVTDTAVEIHGIYYGGRDYETAILDSAD